MIRLDIRLDGGKQSHMEEFERDFSQITNPKLMQRVINNTSTQVLKQILDQMAKTYAFKGGRKKLQEYSTIKKATSGNPTASLIFASDVLEPREYKVSPEQSEANITKPTYTKTGKRSKGRAIKMKVLKSEGMQALTGNARYSRAFIVKFTNRSNSGAISTHVAIVSRDRQEKMTSEGKKNKDRLRKIMTPSVAILAGNDKVYASSSDEIYRIMDEQTRKIVSKVLGGKK